MLKDDSTPLSISQFSVRVSVSHRTDVRYVRAEYSVCCLLFVHGGAGPGLVLLISFSFRFIHTIFVFYPRELVSSLL